MSEPILGHEPRVEILTPGDSVGIRQLVRSDAQAYFDLLDEDRAHLSQFGDETAGKYKTVEDVEGSIDNPFTGKYRFGIWDDETMVGTNNVIILGDGLGETGSWVGAAYIGNHYAERGRKALIIFAFEHLGLRQLVSKVTIGNEASRKSVEASGYTFDHEEDGQWVYVLKKEE